jgi:hypothetical protein
MQPCLALASGSSFTISSMADKPEVVRITDKDENNFIPDELMTQSLKDTAAEVVLLVAIRETEGGLACSASVKGKAEGVDSRTAVALLKTLDDFKQSIERQIREGINNIQDGD